MKYGATNYREIETLIDAGKILGALVIPRDFAGRTARGTQTRVQFIVDGSDANTATIAAGYADGIATGYSQDLILSQQRRVSPVLPRRPLDVRARVWFNPELQSPQLHSPPASSP